MECLLSFYGSLPKIFLSQHVISILPYYVTSLQTCKLLLRSLSALWRCLMCVGQGHGDHVIAKSALFMEYYYKNYAQSGKFKCT